MTLYYFKNKRNPFQCGFSLKSKSTTTNLVSYLDYTIALICLQCRFNAICFDVSTAYDLVLFHFYTNSMCAGCLMARHLAVQLYNKSVSICSNSWLIFDTVISAFWRSSRTRPWVTLVCFY